MFPNMRFAANRLVWLLLGAVVGLLLCAGFSQLAHAVTVPATPNGVNSAGWSATISYDIPVEGVPTEFTIVADGGTAGSGPYQYKQGFIYRHDEKENTWVYAYDPSFGPAADQFQDSNVLSYQFASAGTYRYYFDVRDTVTNYYHSFYTDVVISGNGFQNVEARVQEIVAECLTGAESDYEKALILHDWIIDNVSYDYAYKNAGADKALNGQPVTCEGYNAAYIELLRCAGLEAASIKGGYPDNHIWTAVKMDGEWYQVDTTGDDVGDSLSDETISGFLSREEQMHLLFGLNDDIMGKVLTSHSSPTPGYESNSLENNYFIKTGRIEDWTFTVATTVQAHLSAGETRFTVEATNKWWPQEKYKEVINNLVAYDLSRREWKYQGEPGRSIVATYSGGTYTIKLQPKEATPDSGGSTVPDKPSSGESTTTKPSTGGSSASSNSGSTAGSSSSSSGASSTAAKPKPVGAWKKSQGKWWYRHADGSYTRNGWELIDGTWYHFDKSGWMQTGWIKAGGKWYYLKGSGAMATGWQKLGGTWYYLRSSGAMATGWYKVDGAWYWSNTSGAMAVNRWIGNYYVKGNGAMATNQWIGRYHVDANGKWDKTR